MTLDILAGDAITGLLGLDYLILSILVYVSIILNTI